MLPLWAEGPRQEGLLLLQAPKLPTKVRHRFVRRTSQPNQQRKPGDRPRTVQTVELTEGATISSEATGFAFMSGNHEADENVKQITFLWDSGASDHIVNREDLFSNYTTLNASFRISIAKHGEFISATKRGTLQVMSDTGVQGTLEDVLFCPVAPHHLLSVSRMQRAGLTITFDQLGTYISKDGKILMRGKAINNLISVDFKVRIDRPVSQLCNSDKNNYDLRHQRLGHISKQKF